MNMLQRVIRLVKQHGVRAALMDATAQIVPRRLRYNVAAQATFPISVGIEIGGPSKVFSSRGLIPIYPLARRIDNCNFASSTAWEGTVHQGDTFRFRRGVAPGHQYVAEATDLSGISDGSYDFVLSSHCIEHLANPLRGIAEWLRVLKPGGLMVLVVPHKDGTFDHHRPVTELSHLIADFKNSTDESDLTHLDEILALHDLSRDPGAGSLDEFKARSLLNRDNRCLHHHVFDTQLAVQVADHAGLQILAVEAHRPNHIVIVAKKPNAGQAVGNQRFAPAQAHPVCSSPFPSDRISGEPKGQHRTGDRSSQSQRGASV